MKKYIVTVVCLAVLFSFCGCNMLTSDDSENLEFHENAAYDSEMIDEDDDSFIFTWLSYMEIAVSDTVKTESAYNEHMSRLFENMKKAGVTDCFVQVRPFGDALYKSEIFPVSEYAKKADFDVLALILSQAQSYDIKVHAWINPYRLADNITFKGYGEQSGEIIVTASGRYLNPSADKVRSLIISGVRELLTNYDISGIHIDDYFYPPDMNSADGVQYEQYKKNGGGLSLDSWRRENVSTLLESLYITVKAYGEDKIFSVSPSGDIDKNINQIYADVALWCSEEGYCDIIIPQIYFGFDNEHLPFEETLEKWVEMTDRAKVKLVPALALYKAGREDIYAGKGKDEWQKSSDIISRQVQCLKKHNLTSFGLYSASYINFSKTFLFNELNNLKSVL